MMVRGFTWLELLFVLIITGILFHLCYPNLQTLFYQTEDDVLKNQILRMIHQAQMHADLMNQRVVICQSNDQQNCATSLSKRQWLSHQIVFFNDEEASQASQILNVEAIHPTHGTLYWRAFPHYRHTWFFYPTHRQITDNAAIWHCHDDKLMWSVLVNKVGRARIVAPEELTLNLQC